MYFLEVFKRVAPFFMTLTLGLFVASFFVTVAAPNFQYRRGFSKHREYHRRIESENQRLREENIRLKNRLAEMEKRADWVLERDLDVPPPPPAMPMKTVPQRSR